MVAWAYSLDDVAGKRSEYWSRLEHITFVSNNSESNPSSFTSLANDPELSA